MASCDICYYLTASSESEEHVIRGHFLFEDWKNIHPRQSYFFANIITPWELLYAVQNIPRCQLGQIGWSYSRFLYTTQFDFDVGVYPVQGPGCTTNRVKIVCDCALCPGCDIHVPTDIVTIYPWNEYYAQYGWYWRIPAKRKQKLWRKIPSAATLLNAIQNNFLANFNDRRSFFTLYFCWR